MEENGIARELQRLISLDKLEEACSIIANSNPDFLEDVIMIQGDLATLEKNIIHNTIGDDEIPKQRSKIRSRILLIVKKIKGEKSFSEILQEATDVLEIGDNSSIKKVKEAVELLDYWKIAGEFLHDLRSGDRYIQFQIENKVVRSVTQSMLPIFQLEEEELIVIFKEFLNFIQNRLLEGDDIDEETFQTIYNKIRPSRRKLFQHFFKEIEREIKPIAEMNIPKISRQELFDIFRIISKSLD